jgi:hypothetical protein
MGPVDEEKREIPDVHFLRTNHDQAARRADSQPTSAGGLSK